MYITKEIKQIKEKFVHLFLPKKSGSAESHVLKSWVSREEQRFEFDFDMSISFDPICKKSVK